MENRKDPGSVEGSNHGAHSEAWQRQARTGELQTDQPPKLHRKADGTNGQQKTVLAPRKQGVARVLAERVPPAQIN